MPNVNYTEYDTATGRILRVGYQDAETIPNTLPNESRILEGSDPKTQMIVNGVVVDKNEFSTSSTRSGNYMSLYNVPEDTVITVNDDQYMMDNTSVFEYTVDQPVTVEFMLQHSLYKTKVITIESN